MDITTLIPIAIDLAKTYPWFNIAATVVTIASMIAAVTPTPRVGSKLAMAYSIIDILAFNVGKAKQIGKK